MLRTDELADRLAELQSTLQVLADRARGGDDLDMHFALSGAYRLAFGIARELVDLDECFAPTSYPWPASERSAEP